MISFVRKDYNSVACCIVHKSKATQTGELQLGASDLPSPLLSSLKQHHRELIGKQILIICSNTDSCICCCCLEPYLSNLTICVLYDHVINVSHRVPGYSS